MKASPKSWSLPTKNSRLTRTAWGIIFYASCVVTYNLTAQTINYVNNGGFEDCSNCANYNGGQLIATYWSGIDTNKYFGQLLSELPPSQLVPKSSYAYQWPKNGNNYIISTLYLNPNSPMSTRGYPRNILKQNLEAGKTYCVKLYYNISNQSSYGVDGLGVYFGDNSLDTITLSDKPIYYLTPQIQNPTGNIIKDTLNWVPITGTFTANGTEKYLVLGNFKSDAATDTLMFDPTNLPTMFSDVLYDDVSCIDLDLPASAGYDYYLVPGDSAFIGRQPDVGINEACIWYQSPNLSLPFDTIAGMYVKPTVTTTYVVRQEICGLIRWDTVVVFKSALSIQNSQLILQNLKLFPVPSDNQLNLEWTSAALEKQFTKAEIINSLGQTCLATELNYNDGVAPIDISGFPAGIYTMRLLGINTTFISRRFIKK